MEHDHTKPSAAEAAVALDLEQIVLMDQTMQFCLATKFHGRTPVARLPPVVRGDTPASASGRF